MRTKENQFEAALGRKIKSLREAKDWSQQDLADAAGIGKTQVARIETGKQSLGLKTILAVCKALRLYPHELLNLGIEFDFNLDFNPVGKRRPKTKELLYKLLDTDFFNTPRTVDVVADQCKKIFNIDLLKPAISAVLKTMVERRKLIRNQDGNNRRFLYQKRIK